MHQNPTKDVHILTTKKFLPISLGLQTSEDARFYALSRKFEPFSNRGKPLVLQFTVKHEQNIDCGGGYLKVFDCSIEQKNLHGETPYLMMFGPDICGPGTKRVHVIFNYKGQNHLIEKEIRCKDDVFTHYYTLVVQPDNTYEVLIDNEKVESGSLEDDWKFLAPKKIKDPSATKPADWEDNVSSGWWGGGWCCARARAFLSFWWLDEEIHCFFFQFLMHRPPLPIQKM